MVYSPIILSQNIKNTFSKNDFISKCINHSILLHTTTKKIKFKNLFIVT